MWSMADGVTIPTKNPSSVRSFNRASTNPGIASTHYFRVGLILVPPFYQLLLTPSFSLLSLFLYKPKSHDFIAQGLEFSH
jgi:hypothetical protein